MSGRRSDSPSRHLVVLGSTGSIGRQALEILAHLPDILVTGLAAGSDGATLSAQAASLGVDLVCLQSGGRDLSARAHSLTVLEGQEGLRDLVAQASERASTAGVPLFVLNAIVGAAGLRGTMTTLEHGATLALANKESMVAGGPFVLDAAARTNSRILPVDSEHSAIYQCLAGEGEAPGAAGTLEELLLTGSGGPFRGRTTRDLEGVTPAQALAHPTWAMGPKITVDSSTLMNKGLEVIEAHRLFDVPYERITVLLNPHSVVHSMVRFADGAILAHLGVPDMRAPIAYALAYPRRQALPMVRRLDLLADQIAFERPDPTTFRCLALAIETGKRAAAAEGRSYASGPRAAAPRSTAIRTLAGPIVLNAANEVAVNLFLRGALPFTSIPDIVELCLERRAEDPITSLDDVYLADAEARRLASGLAPRFAG